MVRTTWERRWGGRDGTGIMARAVGVVVFCLLSVLRRRMEVCCRFVSRLWILRLIPSLKSTEVLISLIWRRGGSDNEKSTRLQQLKICRWDDVLQGERIGGSVKNVYLSRSIVILPSTSSTFGCLQRHQTATVRLRGGGAEGASGSCNPSCANIQLFRGKEERRFSCRLCRDSVESRDSKRPLTVSTVAINGRGAGCSGWYTFTGRISANGGGAISP